jgi:uncharacterized protein (TIGR03382 family)
VKAIRFLALLGTLSLALPRVALAFCGFYVAGADGKLFNNATQVVLMREGTRTVLSMQNNYQGPPENFALVVPVPVVLQKENVKTLPREIFAHVDELTAPRLVEYWEQDPCAPGGIGHGIALASKVAGGAGAPVRRAAGEYGVTVEAEFTVGEYEIVILSAQDSGGLEAWLRDNKYRIPDGAEPYLRPYVQTGSKFFVAKVDASKVSMDGDKTLLSPLRFHYDSETFSLPIRLGLINANGSQDLIVTILAKGQRYEAANYRNVTIPTNLDVAEGARDEFGAMYAALFDKTLAANPHAVVTEYAWDAGTCDPCPTPPLSMKELMTLGGDALPSASPPQPAPPATSATPPGPLAPPGVMPRRTRPPWMGMGMGGGFVVSRLHTRYTRESLGEDLVFVAAPPIQGGREWRGTDGQLEKQAKPGPVNNFQARYAIRHPWTGPIACANPIRGQWGGPPGGAPAPSTPKAASKIAFAPRGGVQLASLVREDVPEIGLSTSSPGAPPGNEAPGPTSPPSAPPSSATEKGGCAGCSAAGGSSAGGVGAAALALLVWRGRRRRGSR